MSNTTDCAKHCRKLSEAIFSYAANVLDPGFSASCYCEGVITDSGGQVTALA